MDICEKFEYERQKNTPEPSDQEKELVVYLRENGETSISSLKTLDASIAWNKEFPEYPENHGFEFYEFCDRVFVVTDGATDIPFGELPENIQKELYKLLIK